MLRTRVSSFFHPSAFLSLIAVLLAACATSTAQETPTRDFTITLERSVCFGRCPDYTVSIDEDGNVVFEGGRFVAASGKHEANVGADAAATLLAQFENAGFWTLQNEYRARVTDLPTYVLTLRVGDREKRVLDYGGTMMGMPEIVRDLEHAVDETAQTAQWVSADAAE